METTSQSVTHRAWGKAIAYPGKEFSPTSLPICSGKIPEGLRGSLYRNGPGRLERGGKRMGHWFDGDGAILAVHFTDAGATAVYRYVQTTGYQAEAAADTLLYPNYGTIAPGSIWQRWSKSVKNSANTSVLPLPDKLLALWEGGHPHVLNLQTLETRGTDNLTQLGEGEPFSAHPKCDPKTGEIFNFGISSGLNSKLNLYKSKSTGQIVQKAAFQLKGLPLVHDFVLAGQYLVFFVPPVQVNLLPPAVGLSSFSDAMQWRPELGTQILIFDRDTLSLVARSETEPWYQWHFANGYLDADGSIVIDFVRYKDFGTNQRLKEVATGQTHTIAEGKLWQVHLDPHTGKVKAAEELLNRFCEFPVVPTAQVGVASRYTYLSLHRQDADISQELYGAIARFDSQTNTLMEADLGENRYPSEPLYATDTINPEQGWVLTVVYDGNADRSEVWIFRGDALDEEPVCRLELPGVIPLGFHGKWQSP
ncbi:MAG TPA: hypothetical protein DDZ80_01560 [Cyanobacteria bacterium UBA8803]|nr:hypothetical protein [Cyanobacteria bacterium UBA9273]HBL57289.1 hypothetical protein [Cyanobacteria bacterium UBA8803]